MAKPKTNVWLLAWDQTGLESVVSVSDIECKSLAEEQRITWETLQASEGDYVAPNTAKHEMNHIFQCMLLRARMNSHRHYEIYSIGMDSSISADAIRTMFDEAPQQMVDLIRERGTKHFSDRANNKVVIS